MKPKSPVSLRQPVYMFRAAGLPKIPASHEDPADPGVVKQILIPDGVIRSGQVRMVNWAYLPAGRSFAPHYHEDMQEVFVIAEGRVRMQISGREYDLSRGDALVVPIGVTHTMVNTGETECRYLVFGVSVGKGGRTVISGARKTPRRARG